MDQNEIQAALEGLPLGGFRFFRSIGSTNDEARAWAARGAPDLALVIADEQTAGRGRGERRWFTPPGSALAFSLIIHLDTEGSSRHPALATGLGAIALAESLRTHGLAAQIKWPNDVLIHGRKLAGILVEADWMGARLEGLVLGMGINVLASSVPPSDQLLFPATSLEAEWRDPITRPEFLAEILSQLVRWRPRMGTAQFIRTWEEYLAFRGEQVQVWRDGEPPLWGRLLGLHEDGSLSLRVNDKSLTIKFGEIHLRGADDKIP